MIVYQKDGKTYLRMANNSRGVMRITTGVSNTWRRCCATNGEQ